MGGFLTAVASLAGYPHVGEAAAAETFCSDVFPGPPTAEFTSKISSPPISKKAGRAGLFAKPIFYKADDGLHLPLEDMLRRHGQVEVDVRTNSDTSAARYGFNSRQAYTMPLADALANVSSAPKGQLRPLIFTWERPGLVTELLSTLTVEDESKERLDALREFTMARQVISIGTDEHGLSMHNHEEAWLMMITGRKRWLLMDPADKPLNEKWSALMKSQPSKVHGHAWAWDQAGPLRGDKSSDTPGMATECVQRPGEIMYLPKSWWHSTWNDGIAVGIGGQMHSPGLHRAAGSDNVTAAKLLCEPYGNNCKQSAINVPNEAGHTPMHTAAATGSVNILRWMQSEGFDDYGAMCAMQQVPIIHAANGGHAEAVKFFHNDIGIPMSRGWGGRGRKSIHAAAGYGHTNVVKWLVENGLSVHEKDAKGSEPIHVAVAGSHAETVKWLLANGASSTNPGEDDWTPLMIAAAMGNNADIIDLLQNHRPAGRKRRKQGGRPSESKQPEHTGVLEAISGYTTLVVVLVGLIIGVLYRGSPSSAVSKKEL